MDSLAAAATATESLRLGPMITPVARRRPAKLARETASLRHPDQLAEIGETIRGLRPDPTAPFDIALPLPPGVDPAAYVAAGATWCLTELEPEAITLDHVQEVLRDGPTTPATAEVAWSRPLTWWMSRHHVNLLFDVMR